MMEEAPVSIGAINGIFLQMEPRSMHNCGAINSTHLQKTPRSMHSCGDINGTFLQKASRRMHNCGANFLQQSLTTEKAPGCKDVCGAINGTLCRRPLEAWRKKRNGGGGTWMHGVASACAGYDHGRMA